MEILSNKEHRETDKRIRRKAKGMKEGRKNKRIGRAVRTAGQFGGIRHRPHSNAIRFTYEADGTVVLSPSRIHIRIYFCSLCKRIRNERTRGRRKKKLAHLSFYLPFSSPTLTVTERGLSDYQRCTTQRKYFHFNEGPINPFMFASNVRSR